LGLPSSSASADDRDWHTGQANWDIDIGDIDVDEPGLSDRCGIIGGGDTLAAQILGRRSGRGRRRRGIGAGLNLCPAEVDGETANGNETTPLRGIANDWVRVAVKNSRQKILRVSD
jgi:hypothetical protein